MSREWPGISRREWDRADRRRRVDQDYDVGAATKAKQLAQEASSSVSSSLTAPGYVLVSSSSTLPDGRVLTAGQGITLTDAGAGGALTVATKDVWLTKASDQSKTSNTTYAADTDLQFSVATGVYYIMGRILATSTSALPDIKLQLSWPSSSSIFGSYWDNNGNNTVIIQDATSPAISADFSISANGITMIQFDVVLVASATGTFSVQWAQNSSDPTATTVKAGSFLRYRKTV